MCNFNVDFSKIFWGHSPQTPILGRGYGAPPQTPPPSALRRFAPPRLARDLRSLHRRVPLLTKILATRLLIVNPRCRDDEARYTVISQLTLSLYLMTQCQLKLHHSVTSLAQTLGYIEIAQRRHSADRTLDLLTLKLITRKIMVQICTLV